MKLSYCNDIHYGHEYALGLDEEEVYSVSNAPKRGDKGCEPDVAMPFRRDSGDKK